MDIIKEKALRDLKIIERAFLLAFDWTEKEDGFWNPRKGYPVPLSKRSHYSREHAVNSQKYWIQRGKG